jgi:two-component system chemotaxis sensor kinase CheA
VTVAAAVRENRIVVTVEDDGEGLDIPAIRAQMQRQGVAVPASDEDVARALFQGGLSTRGDATPISGRGVGLDLVRAALERIRGSVSVTWLEGQGTKLVLECPPTLASIRALLVGVGTQTLAIPATDVQRLLRVAPSEIRRVEGRDVLAGEETPVPLVSLARLLPPLAEKPAGDVVNVVLLAANGRRLAVAVDELIAEEEILLRPLSGGNGGAAHRAQRVSGAAVLGTGRVALVLDVGQTITAGLQLVAGGVSVAAATSQTPAKHRVLVVDDSITTRALEHSVLEAAGYDVLTAVDGADAWKILQERGANLVVSDVEMPRMDGFALCEAIRASHRFKSLPIVLVTALESPEHRARGLEVGADAFLGKSSFDQQGLVDTVRQLLGWTER